MKVTARRRKGKERKNAHVPAPNACLLEGHANGGGILFPVLGQLIKREHKVGQEQERIRKEDTASFHTVAGSEVDEKRMLGHERYSPVLLFPAIIRDWLGREG